MVMLARLWRELGLADGIRLEINSIGDAAERRAHRAALVDHFTQHQDALDDEARRRLHTNPLRILDSKNPALQQVVAVLQGSSTAWATHRARISTASRRCCTSIASRSRSTRGSYAGSTITIARCSSGSPTGSARRAPWRAAARYDGLFEQLGGKPTPACGFGMGIERMILLLQDAGRAPARARSRTSSTPARPAPRSRVPRRRRCATPGTMCC
jgi:histidyl-tRNA synthetase